jgi:hypothetical protein
MVTTLLGAAFLPLQVGADEAGHAATMRAGEVFGNVAVDSEDLAVSRGGAELDITLNEAKTTGVVGGNHASNLTTGSNFVNDGSFAGAAGFSTVVQNSGNNVLIQNATVINLRVQ